MPNWFWRMCGFGAWQDRLIRNTRRAAQNDIVKVLQYRLAWHTCAGKSCFVCAEFDYTIERIMEKNK